MRSIVKIAFIALPISLTMTACAPAEEVEEVQEKLDSKVTVETVTEGPFTHEIRVQGNVETDEDVLLTAEMGGLITAILVKEGQKITKGQVIARVDASVLASNMGELKTRLEYAEYMLEKQKELHKRGVGSEFDMKTAQNQVNSINASINSLSTQQGKSVVRAPFSGTIDQVFATQGQMAGPASPIARLVNNNHVDIVATISEKHLMDVHVGTPLMVSFPNYKDTIIHLEVTAVGNYIEPTNRTFRISSTIKNNKLLLPNMLAEVRITDMSVAKGLIIASRAILKDEDNLDFVYVVTKGKDGKHIVKKANVKVLQKFEGKALLDPSSAVKADQIIVVDGAKGITEGDFVRFDK